MCCVIYISHCSFAKWLFQILWNENHYSFAMPLFYQLFEFVWSFLTLVRISKNVEKFLIKSAALMFSFVHFRVGRFNFRQIKLAIKQSSTMSKRIPICWFLHENRFTHEHVWNKKFSSAMGEASQAISRTLRSLKMWKRFVFFVSTATSLVWLRNRRK